MCEYRDKFVSIMCNMHGTHGWWHMQVWDVICVLRVLVCQYVHKFKEKCVYTYDCVYKYEYKQPYAWVCILFDIYYEIV